MLGQSDILAAVDIPAVVRALLGEPNRRLSRGHEWRYGAKGSLAVDVAAGRFMDFETSEGGGLLDLIARECGGSRADAARWLEGMAPRAIKDSPAGARPSVALGSESRSDRFPWASLWHEAMPPEGTAVACYLAGRGLMLPATPSRVLRYHPSCPFGPDRMPAMLALIRNAETGQPQGLHRTPLTPVGARARDATGTKLAKLMLGTASGGAVMLSPYWQVQSSLGVAEGIETALATMSHWPHVPVWAALSAGGIARFPVLSGVTALTVYADADKAGIEASRALCGRYAEAGRNAELVRPQREGSDMADLVGLLPDTQG